MHTPTTDINENRANYAEYRRKARAEGFGGNFREAAAGCLSAHPAHATPSEWVDAAADVFWTAYAEARMEQECEADYDPYGEPEGPGITEPLEVAYGPQGSW
jgi:hypothetical protein